MAAAALPFVPGTQPPSPPDMSTLMGPLSQGMGMPQAGASGDPNEQSRVVMNQIRELHAGVDALARQFPAAAEPAREVKQGLVDMMTAIIGSMSAPEPAGPGVIG